MNKGIELSPEILRKLQLTELELVCEVDRICRKNGINYSLDGGTLLGAVRHGGFIPWDDDADLVFTRHEYAKFYRACKKDLNTKKYFLQEYRTDKNYRWGYAKLRKKGTEYVRLGQEHMKFKTGVFIDLFVNDNVPNNPCVRELYYVLSLCIRKILYSELGKVQEESALIRKIYAALSKLPHRELFKIRNALARNANKKNTELVGHYLYQYPKSCKYGMPAKCFEEYIDIEFEGKLFMVFKDYDKYLSLLYGDYMTLPPESERQMHLYASKIKI